MPGERVVIDGLWRCLCPSIDLTTLSKLASSRQRVTIYSSAPPHVPPQVAPHRQSRRNYHDVAGESNASPRLDDHNPPELARAQYLERIAKRSPWIPETLVANIDPSITDLESTPTKTIYATLRELQRIEGTYSSTVKLVEYLVRERKEKPNAELYESLIRANVDKSRGSAEIAGELLKEMEKLGILITPQIYQALLEVTAVHPDYTLRNTVLFEMKNRWYSPTADDLVNITLGLLRDSQYELALEKLEALYKEPIPVPLWLYDIFLYTFGDLGFHEETLSILKHRLKIASIAKEPLSLNTWHFLLDVFSRDAFYDGIKYVWYRSVSPGHINPPDGVVLNIINAASNHTDITLAISAIQTLSKRGKRLELHHYEALVDIHAQKKDLSKAFTTLCIMAKANLRPDLSSTRSIYRVLRDSSQDTDQSLAILNDLRSNYRVPIAAFNVVLEATEAHHGFKVALSLYRSVRQICADNPDLETYHILLRRCRTRKSMNFLLAEMKAFSIEPTQTTYNHLIRISSMQNNYEQAFVFLEKMESSKTMGVPSNWWMSRDSALVLIKRCIEAEDIRVQELIEKCRGRGLSIDAEIQNFLDDVRKQKKQRVTIKAPGPVDDVVSAEPATLTPPGNGQGQKPDLLSGWG